jgi:hypothetical protein
MRTLFRPLPLQRRGARVTVVITALSSVVLASVLALNHADRGRSGDVATSSQPPIVAAQDAMTALSQPPDVLPAAVATMFSQFEPPDSSGVQESLRPGAPAPGTGHRLLAAAVGSGRANLYAVTTDKGRVCFLLMTGPYGGCITTFGGDSPVPVMVADEPAQVFGLAPDTAASIEVLEGGIAHRAQLENNAYFYESDAGGTYPQTVVVTYRDGSSARIDIPYRERR